MMFHPRLGANSLGISPDLLCTHIVEPYPPLADFMVQQRDIHALVHQAALTGRNHNGLWLVQTAAAQHFIMF